VGWPSRLSQGRQDACPTKLGRYKIPIPKEIRSGRVQAQFLGQSAPDRLIRCWRSDAKATLSMTDSNSIAALHLNNLCQEKPERPGWSLTFGATCAETAAVCLDDQGHNSPVDVQIEGIQSGAIELQWTGVDDVTRRFNADQDVATEYGTYGIADLMLCCRLLR
jgi:hypothetical protein